jgi:hypothetical protein
MKPILKFVTYILLIGPITFASCKKEKPATSVIITSPPTNHPPFANAGKDTTLLSGNAVTLDGSGSTDPDNNITSYAWTKISGPSSFDISNANSVKAQLTNLVQGTFQFELKIGDADGLFSKDSVQVTITPNHPPTANAGADQTIVLPVNTVALDGSSSTDPDNNIGSYFWTKISGPSSFNITNVNTVQTQVTDLVQGTYQFELRVTDNAGAASEDTVVIQVIIDSLSGHEFLFNNLAWFYDVVDGLYVSTPSRPALFFQQNDSMEVYIRLDTSTVWINVPRWVSPLPANNGYLYEIVNGPGTSFLFVDSHPINYTLLGTFASIKVKFL